MNLFRFGLLTVLLSANSAFAQDRRQDPMQNVAPVQTVSYIVDFKLPDVVVARAIVEMPDIPREEVKVLVGQEITYMTKILLFTLGAVWRQLDGEVIQVFSDADTQERVKNAFVTIDKNLKNNIGNSNEEYSAERMKAALAEREPCFPDDTAIAKLSDEEKAFLGLTGPEAQKLAASMHVYLRIGQLDDHHMVLTEEHNTRRITIGVVGGRVVRVARG